LVRSLTRGSSSMRSPSGGRKDFSAVFGKEICGRLSAPVRQRNSRADFAGLDGDVAQVERANG
jgi:hypothetical protein